ncbi:MAG: hypothetical protein ABEK16_05125 [Candidatus Nanohalobium sp.]
MGIHNRQQKLERRRKNVQNSDKISEENKEYFEDVYKWLRRTPGSQGDRSTARIERYLCSLHQMMKHHDFSIQPLNQEKINEIFLSIQESAYRNKGQGSYSASTKAEYRKLVKRLCEKEGKLDLLPKDQSGKIDLKTHVTQSEMKKTRPDQLPSVEDAKK